MDRKVVDNKTPQYRNSRDSAGATASFWQHDVYQLVMAIILIGGATIGATS